MKAPLSWLKDYVDIDVSAQELADKLFSCGFEVEELTYLGDKIDKVVVGQVKSLTDHPDSDHMKVCVVDCGEYGGDLQIVTGAPNVFAGMKTPCALDGSLVVDTNPASKTFGGQKKIKKGKLRGVESCGMLCSGEELGITEDFCPGAGVDGLLVLDDAAPVGEDIRKVVGLDDWIFDISVTANRPDCQSILGIAREVAAVLKKPLKEPDVSYTEHKTKKKPIAVEVQAPDLCPRYIGHYVENVKGGETPAWMRRRLALSGLRSISPVVDITNFVLLEMGQPMHAFDADEIGGGKIVVRRAKQGEKITTLDEKHFALCPDNLVICDGEKPVALAGIMGGLNSEITDGTKNVFFEAAKFARDSVRRTSRSLGQSSDSSFRFEKGVSAYTSEKGMARALHLIEELDCGTVTNLSEDVCAADLTPRKMTASIQKIEALLGIFVPREEIEGILSRLSFAPVLDGDNLTVTVPAWREDVDGYPDLAEEIIRMYGYDHIVPTFLERASVTGGGLSDAQRLEGKVKEVLRTQGFDEACTYSFYSPKEFDLFRLKEDAPERRAVHILNPISEDLSVLRTFLAPSMLQNAVRNIRRGNEEGRQFEIANAYLPRSLPVSGQPEEKKRLALAVWGNKCDFFDLKGAAEALEEEFHFRLSCGRAEIPWLHPGVSARLMLGEKEVGCIGELDPAIALSLGLDKKVYLGELDLEALYPGMSAEAKFVNLPRFPAVKRDLALVADEDVTCAQVEEELMRACKYVTKAELFDVYRGGQVPEGKKSMAFTLTFTPDEHAEKAFTPEALDGFVRKILGNLKFKLNVELR
ncbi:MAG TPA: phenylalanine--tRNA ligase subunit beta [Candidatus Scatosoma pullicola]|nr:phenylalanine--tRNA ligase subunit beta [Candidatus Scatosoma pullicola]